ncbi:MAG: universal stress protein [Candidatus Methanofastidiosa archaeon]|nr:universal stress protein [Candidatus Methanofastidiosa archaeon]
MVKTLFKKVLVPVDGSEQSMKALEYAGKIAKSAEGRVILLYVIDASKVGVSPEVADRFTITYKEPIPVDDTIERYSFFYQEKLKELKDEDSYKIGEQILEEAKKKASKFIKDPDTIISLGPVAETIVTVAENHKTDLIVIGSRGLSTFKRLLMGHVTCDVTEKAHCPVLVIR